MNKNGTSIFLKLLCIILITVSCNKDQGRCHENCFDLTISGKLVDKLTNKPFANVPVRVQWDPTGFCLICSTTRIGYVRSGPDGWFRLKTKIDTTTFEDRHLHINIPIDSNYIYLDYSPENNAIIKDTYAFNPKELRNMLFEFYPKTTLQIKVQNSAKEAISYFTINHRFSDKLTINDHIWPKQELPADSLITVKTAANVYTKIIWSKRDFSGQMIEQQDSLICHKNRKNVYYLSL
ncbi:MAG: hypothetical protein QM669_04985 [Siphonobacter sp.]